MGENPRMRKNKLQCFLEIRGKSLAEWLKKQYERCKTNVKTQLIVLLCVFILINIIWWVFAKYGISFPSPLSHAEAVQALVDIFVAVYIAWIAHRIESRWRKTDEERHRHERISAKMQEAISSQNMQAIGYAVVGNRFQQEYPENDDIERNNCGLCFIISWDHTVPVNLYIDAQSLNFFECTLKCRNRKEIRIPSDSICPKVKNGSLFLNINKQKICDEQKEALCAFLLDVLYNHGRTSSLTFNLQFKISESPPDDKSTQTGAYEKDGANLIYDKYSAEIVFVPVSSFTSFDTGAFNCTLLVKQHYVNEN